MNEDNWKHIGTWTVNAQWLQEWESFDKSKLINLVFYTSPEAELKAIDDAYGRRASETDLGRSMLESIGIKFKDEQ